MKIRHFLAAALVVFAAPAMSTPIISTFDLGTLSVPGIHEFGNKFDSKGSYQDDYTFSISDTALSGALILEVDPLSKLGIDVWKVALSGVGTFSGPNILGLYDFGTLKSGITYTLSVFSKVTQDWGFLRTDVGYGGSIGLLATHRPTPVPEPGTLALLGLGLICIAFAARRRASTFN